MIRPRHRVAAGLAAGVATLLWGVGLPAHAEDGVALPFLPLGRGVEPAGELPTVASSCGRLLVARVTRLPSGPRTRLGAVDAHPLRADGRSLGRWTLPPDAEPLAWMGPDLLVRSLGQIVVVSADGGVRLHAGEEGPPGAAAPAASCPGALAESPWRAGWHCAALPDGRAPEAAPRWLAYQVPCRIR